METFKIFSDIAEISHGVFDDSDMPKGDYSRDWYKEDLVKIYVQKMGFEKCALPNQKHTSDVVITTQAYERKKEPVADGIITKTPGLVIGVQTADCAPVLFCDPVEKVIGAAHAGWKGAIGSVIENTIAEMEKLGAGRKNIRAVVGPCIAQKSYEVDAPIYDPAMTADPESKKFFSAKGPGKWLFDLKGLVNHKLKKAGVSKIEISPRDSYHDPACISYRCATHQNPDLPVKERLNGKRMFSLIVLK
ncbi:MAG: peptidoglycan editing factor PgeF [Alphaproteobacteria bacterium]|nr:peptidoglycan editing factor PgeF [Alphaproteobacteria bacterium]MBN2780110.1 peptidoglycan editing factor PgeF [Alphaproteobacteria bacterium]